MDRPCGYEKVWKLLQELVLHGQGKQEPRYITSLSEDQENFQLSPFVLEIISLFWLMEVCVLICRFLSVELISPDYNVSMHGYQRSLPGSNQFNEDQSVTHSDEFSSSSLGMRTNITNALNIEKAGLWSSRN